MAVKDTLNAMREMQAYMYPAPTPGATAPDFCLAAARFMTGKLAGLFGTAQHLNTFLNSDDAKHIASMKRSDISSAWGHIPTLDLLNGKILPVALKWGGQKGVTFKAELVNQWGDAPSADSLLNQRVPLVVGVTLHGGGGRDHFITLIKTGSGDVYAIDSWGESGTESVVQLKSGFSFTSGQKVSMNGGSNTEIPCSNPFFGYYRELPAKVALKSPVAL